MGAHRRYTPAMTYVLHYAPDNASLIVRLALEQVGAPYRTVLVDRAAGAQHGAAYRAINPNGLIPALETPDGILFETSAILLYLAGRHDGLMPRQGAEAAAALKWLVWMGNTLHPSLRMMFYPHIYTTGDPEDLRAPARTRITRALGILADAPDAPWLDGRASAMGFYLGPMLRWLPIYGGPAWFRLKDHPRLLDFAVALQQIPAVEKTARAEGLGLNPFTAPQMPNPPEGSAL